MATYLLMSEDEMVYGAVRLLTERMERRKGVLGKAREVMERYGLDTGFLYRPNEMNAKARKEGLAELGRAQKKALTTRLEEKVYHGSHATEVRGQGVDKKATHAWVKEGKLMPKSEGIIMAAQDRILSLGTSDRDTLTKGEGGLLKQEFKRVNGKKFQVEERAYPFPMQTKVLKEGSTRPAGYAGSTRRRWATY